MALQGCNLVDYNYHLLAKVDMTIHSSGVLHKAKNLQNRLMLRVRIQYAKKIDQLIISFRL